MPFLDNLRATLPEGIHDVVDMLMSVMATFPEDDLDEGRPDEVDEWTFSWAMRIRQWIDVENSKLSVVVIVQDSHDSTVEDAERRESIFVEMVVALQRATGALAATVEKARLQRSAAMAQAWDAWAVAQSMEQGSSPNRLRTVGTQVDEGMLTLRGTGQASVVPPPQEELGIDEPEHDGAGAKEDGSDGGDGGGNNRRGQQCDGHVAGVDGGSEQCHDPVPQLPPQPGASDSLELRPEAASSSNVATEGHVAAAECHVAATLLADDECFTPEN